jgi:DNA-directed RNA polymerase II subunit RPB3
MPPAASSSASAEGKQRTPRVTVQELTDSTIRFVLEGTDTSMANALRRVIIAEVPTIAIDLVEVIENSSCLCDEFLAHRLGLIPLLSEKASEMEFPYDYAGDDESKTDVSIDLRVKCVSDNTVDVTSDDLICNDDRVVPIDYDPSRSSARGGDPDAAMDANEDSSTAPDKKGILIVKLRKNQELNLRCVARKGIGRDHAKWQPVATAVYRFEPEITIDEDLMATLTEEEKREFAESSPAPIFRYNEQTRKVEIDAPETCTYDGECLKKAEELGKPGLVDIRAKQDVFLFTVESTGVLRPEEIVVHALNVLQRKLNVTKGELDILKKQEEERYGDRM